MADLDFLLNWQKILQYRQRKKRKLTQAQLSERAGVSLASLKRFEKLFTTREYSSIQEVIDEKNKQYRS